MNTKKKKKICYNCKKQSSNLKKGIVSKKIASWKKKLGLKTKLPGNFHQRVDFGKNVNRFLDNKYIPNNPKFTIHEFIQNIISMISKFSRTSLCHCILLRSA